jgi:DNA-binding MarR family transcriptional regulator
MPARVSPTGERVAGIDGPDLCYCLAARRTARQLTRVYDQHLAPIGLSCSQFSILSFLERQPGITVPELAELMVMERTTLVRALKPLQKAGLVAAEFASGKRNLELALTRAGHQRLDAARPHWETAQAAVERDIGVERAARLRQEILEIGGVI